MRPFHAIMPVVGSGLLLAAMGAAPPAGNAPSDACSLLTQAEVSAALGVPSGPAQHLAPKGTTLCGWGEAGKAAPADKRVVASIETTKAFGYEKTPVQGIVKSPLTGVGDDAVYVTTPPFGTGLSVKKGDFAFKIRVYGFADDVVKAKEKALALEALAKL
jgi:hypothetical protein